MTPRPSEIRRAFSLLVTNVAVVTVADADGIHGCTANAWAEAPEPPLLLVTLRRGGTTGNRVAACGRFAVSVLADGQEALARDFAGRGDRFARVSSFPGPALGQPMLPDALLSLECELEARHPFGAQEIFVGRVASVSADAESRPLAFFARRFVKLEPDSGPLD